MLRSKIHLTVSEHLTVTKGNINIYAKLMQQSAYNVHGNMILSQQKGYRQMKNARSARSKVLRSSNEYLS